MNDELLYTVAAALLFAAITLGALLVAAHMTGVT